MVLIGHPTFAENQRRHHQKSGTEASVAPKMDMYPTKILKKKKLEIIRTDIDYRQNVFILHIFMDSFIYANMTY